MRTALVALVLLLAAPTVAGELYRWEDSRGVAHFSDRLEDVPAAQREQVVAPGRYEPERRWTEVSPLPAPRWFHMAGVGSDGRVYAYGGYVRIEGRREYGVGPYAIDVIDPASGATAQGPPITAARIKSLSRKVVGRLDEHNQVQDESHYDERISTTRLRPEIPMGRADPLGRPLWPLISYWQPFEPERGAWAELAVGSRQSKPGPDDPDRPISTKPVWFRYTPTLATGATGLVYVTGGSGYSTKEENRSERKGSEDQYHVRSTTLAAVEVWDANTRDWHELPPMRRARMLHAAAVDRRGRLFVFGGSEGTGGSYCLESESRSVCDARSKKAKAEANRSLSSVEMYDPEMGTWSQREPLPTPRQSMGAELGADGRIYVVGGARSYAHPRPIDVVEIYDPETNSWSEGPPLLYARRSHAVVSIPDGRLYAIGGFVGIRQRTAEDVRKGHFLDPALGATVEVLETTPAP